MGLFRRAQIRFGDDLQQRHAGPVQVDQGRRAAAFAEPSARARHRVGQLAGVLLQVGPRNADALDLGP